MNRFNLTVNNEDLWFDYSDGKHPDNSQLQDMVDDVIEQLMSSDDDTPDFGYYASGGTLVIGTKLDDEIDIYITHNYKEANIYKGWRLMNYGDED